MATPSSVIQFADSHLVLSLRDSLLLDTPSPPLKRSAPSSTSALCSHATSLAVFAAITIVTALASGPRSQAEQTDRPLNRLAKKSRKTLSQLKDKLAEGDRDEFPAGTVVGRESHFYIPSQSLNWNEAQKFAEEHGAHLAVLPRADYRLWLQKSFRFKGSVWLGAGLGARENWQWIDGSPWSSSDKLVSGSRLHRRVSFSDRVRLSPANASQRYRFILQWRNDGSNPGSLEAQLKRTVTDFKTKGIVAAGYPIGTRSREDSRYLLIDTTRSWEEARRYANSLAASLAVPSSDPEHRWIRGTFGEKLLEDEALWLGGFRTEPNDRWQWLTGERWNNLGWNWESLREGPLLNRLTLHRESNPRKLNWVASAGSSGGATALLLEWSPLPTPASVVNSNWERELRTANQTIAGQIESELLKFRKGRTPMIKEYVQAMKRIAQNSGSSLILKTIEHPLDEAAKEGRLLESLPDDASDALQAEQETWRARLNVLEETHQRIIDGQLNFYMQAVRKVVRNLSETGYLARATKLKKLIGPIESDAFVNLLFAGAPKDTLPWSNRN
jgi:hypothetical protein